jgi:hypothetical protein
METIRKKRRVSTTLRQVLTEFSELFLCWIGTQFPHKTSRQDRLATTIGNPVDPQHPRFCCFSGAFCFFKVDRSWHLIAFKEVLAFSSALQFLRCCFIWLLPQAAVAEWGPVC